MECCGQERRTRFCADCGSPLKAHGLYTLLLHCNAKLGVIRNRAVRLRKWADRQDDADDRERALRAERSMNKHVAKWQGWVDAIEKALDIRQDASEDVDGRSNPDNPSPGG